MKNADIGSTKTTNRVPEALLRGNAQILFLPSGCEDLKDSNYESYLDCILPESAICLSGGEEAQIAIGDGCQRVTLLETNGNRLRFTSAATEELPAVVQTILQHLVENLDGHPSQRCTDNFVQWLYLNRPTRMATVLDYFLSNPNFWLIGLPGETLSKHLFSEAPIYADDAANNWYRLCDLQVCEPQF